MAASNDYLAQLPSQDWDDLDRLLKQFEAAWHSGARPILEDYWPRGGNACLAVLIELVHADLECRFKAGEAVRVETYLERYPELAGAPEGALGLIAAEYALRRGREPGCAAQEYLQRFPH